MVSSYKMLIYLCFCLNVTIFYSQSFPGGVTGAEVWYIVDWEDVDNDVFNNSSQTDITLKRCNEYTKSLFNFNPSITSETLCLYYVAPLENSTGRNSFFVGELYRPEYSNSHLATDWLEGFENITQTDSIIRNFFDLNSKSLYGWKMNSQYSYDQLASVNFYHSNFYNIDKKFKSFGQHGETVFYIGKKVNSDYDDIDFNGNFPEFISFPRELNKNERNRIESYLAVKYGLTLNEKTTYLNSKNVKIWNSEENDLFHTRVFGVGKDNISGLNQLISQSTHLKDHLIAGVEAILETNKEMQAEIVMSDSHYLLFGDNGKSPALKHENSQKIRFWEKIWLAQRTGLNMENYSLHFKLFLTEELDSYLRDHPTEKLWLLKDRFVENDEVSDFDNQHVEYISGDVDFEQGIAIFKDVFFDSDRNVFDQFTFGVGPEMIVQAQLSGCKKDKLEIQLEITGGKPPYLIVVESDAGNFEEEIEETTFTFSVQSGFTYIIKVYDDQGLMAEVEITVEPWEFNLELGPDQYLNVSQTEIILNAGQGITDQTASYQWYFNGNLLPNTESSLTVTEAGTYEVIVTSGDLACTVTDQITILNGSFEAIFSITEGCDEAHNSLSVVLDGGIPPFTTTISGINGSVNYSHMGNTIITDIYYGSYVVTVADSVGNIFEDNISFAYPTGGLGLNLYAQLEALCGDIICISYSYSPPLFYQNPWNPFQLDASIGVNNSNVTYEWFKDGEPLDIFSAVVSFIPSNNCDNETYSLITVVANDYTANCSESQSFNIRSFCPVLNPGLPPQTIEDENNQNNTYTPNLSTRVHPNPSEPNVNFTYSATASEEFNGTVEVFTPTGSRVYRIEVNGASHYELPFALQSAGMYLIKTTSSLGIINIDRIIIR